jgi:hypothetical protein
MADLRHAAFYIVSRYIVRRLLATPDQPRHAMTLVSGYTGPRRSWTNRAVAAARLDVTVYEEVEADSTANGQAALVVAVTAVAQAIGSSGNGVGDAIGSVIGTLLGWLIWSGVTYLIGAGVFKGTATYGELLRTLGFAQAPGVFYVLGVIPGLGDLFELVVAVWILVAGIIAIRQALDITTGKAILVAVLGWLALLIPVLFFGAGFLAGRS